MHSRSFPNVSLGVLALALAYHLGASTAHAVAGNPIVGLGPGVAQYALTAVCSDGDVYGSTGANNWTHIGYVFSGGATSVQQQTLGSVKVRYR